MSPGPAALDVAADRDHVRATCRRWISMVFAARKLEALDRRLGIGREPPALAHADLHAEAVLAVLIDRVDLINGADRKAFIADHGAVFDVRDVVEQHAIAVARPAAPGDQRQRHNQRHDHGGHEQADRHVADGIIPH
jgi:DNA polymerase III epsilon subunit-like protein